MRNPPRLITELPTGPVNHRGPNNHGDANLTRSGETDLSRADRVALSAPTGNPSPQKEGTDTLQTR
jgi:hypothetical protein